MYYIVGNNSHRCPANKLSISLTNTSIASMLRQQYLAQSSGLLHWGQDKTAISQQNIKLFIQQNAFENAVYSILKCILLNEKFYILI